jgi:hypothetical protein
VSKVAVDPLKRHIYLAANGCSQVFDYDVASDQFLPPIQLSAGTQPYDFDFSPDGCLMYVANGAGNAVLVVDLALRTEIRDIPIGNVSAVAIAVARNNVAIIGTWNTPFNADILKLDLSTGEVQTVRAFSSTTTEGAGGFAAPELAASADRSAIGGTIAERGCDCANSYSILRYDSDADEFHARTTFDCSSFMGISNTGKTIATNSVVYDASLRDTSLLPGCFYGPLAFVGTSNAYQAADGAIYFIDVAAGAVTGGDLLQLPQGELEYALAASADGALAAVVTTHYLDIYVDP